MAVGQKALRISIDNCEMRNAGVPDVNYGAQGGRVV